MFIIKIDNSIPKYLRRNLVLHRYTALFVNLDYAQQSLVHYNMHMLKPGLQKVDSEVMMTRLPASFSTHFHCIEIFSEYRYAAYAGSLVI